MGVRGVLGGASRTLISGNISCEHSAGRFTKVCWEREGGGGRDGGREGGREGGGREGGRGRVERNKELTVLLD